MTHPLDRAVWNALGGRLSRFATADSDERARRIDPEVGVFLTAADGSDAGLQAMAALARTHPGAGVVERSDGPMADVLPPGIVVERRVDLVQMVCSSLTPGARDVAYGVLTEADAPAMLAHPPRSAPHKPRP
ncbi:MAG: GNAT family N-acetyltransferase, partial [Brevundimonas sp.]